METVADFEDPELYLKEFGFYPEMIIIVMTMMTVILTAIIATTAAATKAKR